MRTYSCILFVLASCVGWAQQPKSVSIKPAPSWITRYTFKDELKDTTNTSGGYYNLLYDDQYNPAQDESYHHYVQKILTEKGLEAFANLSFDFDPAYQTFTVHQIDIVRNGERVNQLSLGKFKLLQRE